MSALVTDVLCPSGRLNLAIIGAGAQARAHVTAMAAVRDFDNIYVFSRSFARSAAFAEELVGAAAATVIPVRSIDEAVVEADIICTTTSHESPEPLIYSRQIKSTAHINAIGGSTVQACEVDPGLLRDAQIYVDNIDAARCESGEIATALASSIIVPERILDLSALVSLQSITFKKTISYFRCVGHASQDMVVAACVYKAAMEARIGKFCSYFGT